jgi:hypothetical protein
MIPPLNAHSSQPAAGAWRPVALSPSHKRHTTSGTRHGILYLTPADNRKEGRFVGKEKVVKKETKKPKQDKPKKEKKVY